MARIILKNGLEANVASAVAMQGEVLIALDSHKMYVGTNNNGGLGSTDKVELTNVVIAPALASFPATGIDGKLYVAKAEKKTYIWSGTAYEELHVDIDDFILDTAVAGDKTHTYSADKIITLLLGKADKVTGAVANDIAILDVNGNLVDSGKKLTEYVTLVGIETITNKTIDADNNTITNLEIDNFKTGVVDTDINLTAQSDLKIATQRAVKAYIDNTIAGIAGGLDYKGTLDASNLGTQLDNRKLGDFFKVSVKGTILTTLDLEIGDMVIINKDITGTPTLADLDVIDNTESADLLRIADISSNIDFTVDTGKLATRDAIRQYVANVVSAIDGGTF